jgi:hypothetical protein
MRSIKIESLGPRGDRLAVVVAAEAILLRRIAQRFDHHSQVGRRFRRRPSSEKALDVVPPIEGIVSLRVPRLEGGAGRVVRAAVDAVGQSYRQAWTKHFKSETQRRRPAKLWQMPQAAVLPTAPPRPDRLTPVDVRPRPYWPRRSEASFCMRPLRFSSIRDRQIIVLIRIIATRRHPANERAIKSEWESMFESGSPVVFVFKWRRRR